ncbi:MAG TPA: SpoIIE family protein phosphatase [Phycisphaerae bacterium]|nr:SpoIIE family protein phosphatase [Phycisphaerae bacterium]HOJ75671.1 SpoIIE family protein phosphatase [Phycisphaerae bacterium]HOM52539.1 SpoIIE family protein phosphatase [Phycisphaerae bacterium]HON66415.1 SpoIIE family protein phosphatase [Phycisphaerae bacterium]HOQ88190.1 SpoIIE family protein phosphatase [Phycisphaerae bacterium]
MSDARNDAAHDLAVLVDVARRLGETFDLDSLLQSVEQAGRSALGCERATVFLYDAGRDELYSKVATGTDEIRFSARLGIAGEAVQTRDVILVPDAYADPRFNRDIDRKTGYRTRNLLTLPMIAPDGQVIGVLQVLNKIRGEFEENDVRLASALGALTGVAIKRQMLLDESAARQRLERDLNIAREIQQRLLPKQQPVVPGYDIAGWNLAADQTGGDMYDFIPLPDGRLGVMIADATGHGIGPALIVSQCRSVLRAVADGRSSPSQLVCRLNDLLCDDLPSDKFVTLCFGILDPIEHRLDYVSAGHGPQLHLRVATGDVDSFNATGVPLGIMPGTPIEPAEPVRFEPGDLFVMITDGFMEWCRADGEQYGTERLIDLLRHHHTEPSASLIERLYADVQAFSQDTPQLDDLTVIVVKRTT